MPVYGIGCDIAHIPRFLTLLNRYGHRFLNRAFHPEEIAFLSSMPGDHRRAQFAASRWAVKEATLKACGSRLHFPEIFVSTKSELNIG